MMFPVMLKCSEGLIPAVESQDVLDINDVSVRYTIDIIGNCVFGLECNSLKQCNTRFQEIAQKVTNPPWWNSVKFFTALLSPNITKLARIQVAEQEIIDFFVGLVRDTIEYREKNSVNRNDFMQLMINLKKADEWKSNEGLVMDLKTVTAQAFVFFAAGYETSSMTINLCLFELSQNQEMQERVRDEIRGVVKEDGGITYDGIMAMTYLDKIVQG